MAFGFSVSWMRVTYRRHLGKHFSEGARLLWLKTQELKLDQEGVRHQLELSRGVVGRWLYGDRAPDLDSAVKIEAAYGIPVAAWTQVPSKPFKIRTTVTPDAPSHRTAKAG